MSRMQSIYSRRHTSTSTKRGLPQKLLKH